MTATFYIMWWLSFIIKESTVLKVLVYLKIIVAILIFYLENFVAYILKIIVASI
jgi:polyferredoxin